MASEIKSVGVIGLGKMGGPMARHLGAKGFSVMGYDADGAKIEALGTDGVAAAASPAELAAKSDLVIVVVGFDSEVDDALFGTNGAVEGAKDGAIIAVASTVAPGFMRALPGRAGECNVTFLDIPLCRGEKPAIEGKLLIMGGGDEAVFEACRPAFSTFADAIFHLGPLGAGQVGKMVNNLILWTCISGNVEGMKLAEALGVDGERLREALLESSAGNWALKTQAHLNPMPWAEKDMTIVLKEADAAALTMPLSGVVKEVIKGIKLEKGAPIPRPRGKGNA